MDDQSFRAHKRQREWTSEPESPIPKRRDADGPDGNDSYGRHDATDDAETTMSDENYHSCSDGEREPMANAQERMSLDQTMEHSHRQENARGRVVINTNEAEKIALTAKVEDSDEENEEIEANNDEEDEEEDLFAATFGKQADCARSSSEDEEANRRSKNRKRKRSSSKGSTTEKTKAVMPIKKKSKNHPASTTKTSSIVDSSGHQSTKPTSSPVDSHDRSIKDVPLSRHEDSYDFQQSEHSNPCNAQTYRPSSPPLPSTPRPELSQGTPSGRVTTSVAGGRAGAGILEYAPALQSQNKFHTLCVRWIPRLPLPQNRYWLGILHITKYPEKIRTEKDFMWLKGNRRTTVQTLRNLYATTSARAEESVELLLEGSGKVRPEETMEELDLFGEKRVMFWAQEKKKKLLGQRLTPAAAFDGSGNGIGGSKEVIEIEDD